ncbi:MAG: thioredoxin domain-containing protein [Bacteroidota bacterium]|nr:thioredoxin domain-containing protein [Candidatus Kapabacteria bacterium]MDW8220257.1 thioredoxin domain-containing protein [Bacteroidota bacterium]
MDSLTQHRYTNALIHEKSPYLLQHAHNPVNWYPWGEEAFARARQEDKPIFLSIGYATCHWCHVMERESFENEDIARFLNEHYISIKVDREERPDIDALYMRICQGLTGHGGWPLTIFMSPDKQPFFAGTYFPSQNYYNRPGFPYILERIVHAWKHERAKIQESCRAIVEHFRTAIVSSPSELDSGILDRAYRRYEELFDSQYGGFGTQPKFPSPQNLLFLLRYYKRTQNPSALAMVERTLVAMRHGGIFDHIGYGFHRYSTDREWVVPHFEKMLYDQAMLALAYVEAHQATRGSNPVLAQTAEEIFTYVLRDMTDSAGGLYSAEDADSEGHEGKFYVWSADEIHALLDAESAALFCLVYSIHPNGNFHDEASGTLTGYNIPYLHSSLETIATQQGIEYHELRAKLAVIRETLFYHREQRVRPLRDDKILADWNGLMIAAFALGGRVLDNALYTQAAERALTFLLESMIHTHGNSQRLLHRYRDGDAAIPAFLDDYAFVAWGAFELYQTTFSLSHLRTAIFFADEMIRLFFDECKGVFRFSAADNEPLILDITEAYDGAIPSGNSVAATVLARLGKLLSKRSYQDIAARTIQHFAQEIHRYPTGFAQMLIAYDFLYGKTQEILIAGHPHDSETHSIIRLLAEEYMPHAVFALNSSPRELAQYIEQAAYQGSLHNHATTYVCENAVCYSPLIGSEALQAFLSSQHTHGEV